MWARAALAVFILGCGAGVALSGGRVVPGIYPEIECGRYFVAVRAVGCDNHLITKFSSAHRSAVEYIMVFGPSPNKNPARLMPGGVDDGCRNIDRLSIH